jgi:hypothetical protein
MKERTEKLVTPHFAGKGKKKEKRCKATPQTFIHRTVMQNRQ